MEHGLSTANCENRHEEDAASADGAVDNLGEAVPRVFVGVRPIAIGGLDHDVVGGQWRCRGQHDRVVAPTQVTTEVDRFRSVAEPDGRGTEDVARSAELRVHARRDVERTACFMSPKSLQGAFRIVLREQRQRGRVSR